MEPFIKGISKHSAAEPGRDMNMLILTFGAALRVSNFF